MNKLHKIILTAFMIGIGIFNITNASKVEDKITILEEGTVTTNANTYVNLYNIGTNYGTYCIYFSGINVNNSQSSTLNIGFAGTDTGTPSNLYKLYQNQTGQRVCLYGNKNYLNAKTSNNYAGQQTYKVFKLNTLLNENLEGGYSSIQCQTEYNLIPIENITANYCKLNFDLIEPTECPDIGEGTGEINRTAWYINNQQYPGTASLKLNIADFLERQTTYNQDETIVDIIGVDADEEYIEDIITKTQITPTAEDFGNLINGLQAFIPYVMIGLLLSFAILLVKKVFK